MAEKKEDVSITNLASLVKNQQITIFVNSS